MSSWTTITVKASPELPDDPYRYASALVDPLDGDMYRVTEKEDHAIVTVSDTERVEECLTALFEQYINRYLCPGATVIEAEDTGDSRTARVVRPNEKGDGERGEYSVDAEVDWIDRENEGVPGRRDAEMEKRIEKHHNIPATTIHYHHHA